MIYHCHFVELLAEATSGLNHQTEVQAQAWVTAPTCFEVLLSDISTVDPMLKTVYARYLAEAWFNTQVSFSNQKTKKKRQILKSKCFNVFLLSFF